MSAQIDQDLVTGTERDSAGGNQTDEKRNTDGEAKRGSHQHCRKCRFSFRKQQGQDIGKENAALHHKVTNHEETIESLQDRIQMMQSDHNRQVLEIQQQHRTEMEQKDTEHKKEVSRLRTVISKAVAWFPYLREMIRIENCCLIIGFNERQTATLVSGKSLEYEEELYSEEHRRKFTTEKAGSQVVKDPKDRTKLILAINKRPIAEWFKE